MIKVEKRKIIIIKSSKQTAWDFVIAFFLYEDDHLGVKLCECY